METLTQNIIDTIKLQNNPRFDEAHQNENGQVVVPVGRTFTLRHSIKESAKKSTV